MMPKARWMDEFPELDNARQAKRDARVRLAGLNDEFYRAQQEYKRNYRTLKAESDEAARQYSEAYQTAKRTHSERKFASRVDESFI